jgi:hypothetical protein
MTDHIARLYALAVATLVFFVAWAAVAANPFPEATASPDPRLVALQKREARLAREQERVSRLVERRFQVYRRKLAERRRVQAALDASAASAAAAASPAAAASASAPAPPAPVQVTSAPPVSSSGSS